MSTHNLPIENFGPPACPVASIVHTLFLIVARAREILWIGWAQHILLRSSCPEPRKCAFKPSLYIIECTVEGDKDPRALLYI